MRRLSTILIVGAAFVASAGTAQAEESAPTAAQATRAIHHAWKGFPFHRDWCRRGAEVTRCKVRIRVHECSQVDGSPEVCVPTFLVEFDRVRWQDNRLAIAWDSSAVWLALPPGYAGKR